MGPSTWRRVGGFQRTEHEVVRIHEAFHWILPTGALGPREELALAGAGGAAPRGRRDAFDFRAGGQGEEPWA